MDSDEIIDWEANPEDDGVTMLCPGCLTLEEERFIDRDAMDQAREKTMRGSPDDRHPQAAQGHRVRRADWRTQGARAGARPAAERIPPKVTGYGDL